MGGAAANYMPARRDSLTAPPVRSLTQGTTRTQENTRDALLRAQRVVPRAIWMCGGEAQLFSSELPPSLEPLIG